MDKINEYIESTKDFEVKAKVPLKFWKKRKKKSLKQILKDKLKL